ncbi:MAG: hypothetical protein KatS3mg087_1141 [Patescibacteria group bacterium]|nr:MAG: hypothetical protein KatS3mg087_1141 [Patescibacteria group bacterium]
MWERCDAAREAYYWVAENYYLVVQNTPIGPEFHLERANSPPPNAIALSVLQLISSDPAARKEFFLKIVANLYSKKFTHAKDLATAFGLNPRHLIMILSGVSENKIDELKRIVNQQATLKQDEVTLTDIVEEEGVDNE